MVLRLLKALLGKSLANAVLKKDQRKIPVPETHWLHVAPSLSMSVECGKYYTTRLTNESAQTLDLGLCCSPAGLRKKDYSFAFPVIMSLRLHIREYFCFACQTLSVRVLRKISKAGKWAFSFRFSS